MQDIEFCKIRYPDVLIKPIALQFLSENDLAILEVSVNEANGIFNLSVVDERHYQLVNKSDISDIEIRFMSEHEN